MSTTQKIQYWALTVGASLLVVWLLWYWISPNRLNGDLPQWQSIPLFLMLSFVMFHRPVLEALSWVIARKQSRPSRQPAPQGLKVAVITTFVAGSEPIDMLTRTLKAMIENDDYPHDVWVLDESNDPEVQLICQHFGVHHFSRKGKPEYNTDGGQFAARTKGGNHNAWYDAHGHEYDIVSQWDTDFVVKRGYLTKVLGYFHDERVAFVGTPQVYGNMQSWVARGAAQQTYLFYGPIMNGAGTRKQGLLIGANHTIRVAALRDVGWYFAHLAEDMATGMRLHAAGWKGAYHPEVLAVGEGPSKWQAYFTQQYRWASGSLDLLFNHTPKLIRTMPWQQALRYVWIQLFYLNGLTLAVGASLLMLFFFTGVAPAEVELIDLFIFYLPLLMYRQGMMMWLQRFNVRPYIERGMLWAGRFLTIAALPVYMMAFFGAVLRKKVEFKVTPKGEGNASHESLMLFKHHLAIGGVLLVGAYSGLLLGHVSWIFHGWALITAALMLGFTLVPTVLTQLSVYLVQVQLRLKATVANWAAQVRVRVREVGVKS